MGKALPNYPKLQNILDKIILIIYTIYEKTHIKREDFCFYLTKREVMTKDEKNSQHINEIKGYAEDVVSGKIPAGIYIQKVCEKFLSDLEDDGLPYEFDETLACRPINFIGRLPHVKGKLSGTPIELLPFQKFFIGNLFGWVDKKTRLRKYTEAALILPRKNAKSTIAAGIGLYMLLGDGELGPEVFCGAATEVQGFICFNLARSMIITSPKLKASFGLKYTKEVISCDRQVQNRPSLGIFRPIIGSPKDGTNPSMAIVDEYHEHPNDKLYDSLKNGMGSRENPLLLVTTTAGNDPKSACFRYVENGRKNVLGITPNENHLYLEYTLDDGDDWKDFEVWEKSNPGIGYTTFHKQLREQYNTALTRPDKRNQILTKHLNVWTNEGTGWINYDKWKSCKCDLTLEDFAGEDCWIGLDLASKVDLTSLVMCFRREEKYYFFCYNYLPSETVELPENEHYRVFRDQEYLTVTEGARTDYRYVEDDLRELSAKYNIRELAYDQREAEYLMQNIREWSDFPCIEFTQSAAHLSEPMKEMEALILNGDLQHSDNPIFNWAASNVIVKENRNKLIHPAKTSNDKKIDPIVAAIMALARAKAAVDDSGGTFIMVM